MSKNITCPDRDTSLMLALNHRRLAVQKVFVFLVNVQIRGEGSHRHRPPRARRGRPRTDFDLLNEMMMEWTPGTTHFN